MADVDVYVVRFWFPTEQAEAFAGLCDDGGWGFAPTLATAYRFTDPEHADRVRVNGYGPTTATMGSVVRLDVTG